MGVMDVAGHGPAADGDSRRAARDDDQTSHAGGAEARRAARTEDGPDRTAEPLASDRVLGWADRNRCWLFAGLVLLYLAGFNGRWRPEPDSALYLAIGRNLAEGRGYTYHGQPHHLVFPGLPLLFAGVFRVFGGDNLVAAHAVMLLMGFAALALTYRLFLLHAGRPTAVMVTLLVGLSRTLYQTSYQLMSDLPFLVAVLAFLAGYEAVLHGRAGRRVGGDPSPPPDGGACRAGRHWAGALDWLLLVGGLAAAVVTRPAMLALVLAVAGAVAWSLVRGPVRWGGVLILLGVLAAGVTFYALDPRRQAAGQVGVDAVGGGYEWMLLSKERLFHVLHRAITENLWKVFHPTVAEAVFGMDLGKTVNPWVSALLLVAAFWLFRAHVLWGMLIVATLAMMAVEVHVRYLLFVLPLLMYATWGALAWLNRRPGRRARAEWAFVAVFALLLCTNLARVGGFIVSQRQPDVLREYKRGKFVALDELVAMLRRHTGDRAYVLVQPKLGRILTYTSGRYAIEPYASSAELDPALQDVYVLDPIDTLDEKDKTLDTRTRDWMAEKEIVTGEAVASVPDGRGGTWTLHRAKRGKRE